MRFSSSPGHAPGRTADHHHPAQRPAPRALWTRTGAGAAALALLLSGCGLLDDGEDAQAEVSDAEAPEDEAPEETPDTEASEEATEPEEPEDDDADEEPAEDEEGGEPDRDLTEPVVVQETVWDFDGGQEIELEITIHPFMRDSFEGEDFISGNMTYEVISDEGEFSLEEYGTHPVEVRLFDPEDPEVLHHPTAASTDTDLDWVADVESGTASAGEGQVPWAAIYSDPGTDTTAVLLPYVGLVEDVGIVDRADVSPQDYITFGQAGEGINDISLSSFPLDTYRERAGGDVNIREEDGQTVLTLDAEILFDSDDHTIRDDAEDALDAAAEELERAAGGELQIVGHTDDIDTEQYNQTLSENRADSVHDHLDDLVDLDEFDEVTTEGRGLHEPIASNETEEGRQLNRRVELHFTPLQLDEIDEADGDSGDLPEAEGPVAEGDESLTVTAADDRASDVQVESLRRVGNVLVGRIGVEVTDLPEDQDGQGQLAWPLSFGDTGAREDHDHDFNSGSRADALTLLLGDQRVFPLEYSGEINLELEQGDDGEIVEEDYPWHLPLVDRGFGYQAPAEVGTRATATVIWPAVPAETVTIDVPAETEHAHRPYADPFRFTDVPVEDADAADAEDGTEEDEGDEDGDED